MKQIGIIIGIIVFLLIVWVDLPTSLHMGKFTLSAPFRTHLGLDLQGGSSLVFQADTSRLKPEDVSDAVNSARDIIEKRVNFFGVSEPLVQTIKAGNTYRIMVDLPGIGDVSQAVSLIGATAQLSFKGEATVSAQEATSTPELLRLTKDTGITGRDIKKASVVFDQQTGKPEVQLEFTTQGADKFAQVTGQNIGKPIAIYLDQFILSAPVVQQQITGGSAVISGSFTTDQAKQLAVAINSGALPLPIKLVQQRNIGPSLGATDVQRSLIAGAIGLAMVLVFMIGYYGKFGLIASAALMIYGLIAFALFRVIPVVLTLPGVAGFILSIGMAVDSNILIFERIKEELRKGRDQHTAIRLGFGRAIDAIKDANITTLIVAFILFNPLNWDFLPQFGIVRGFALTLAIGVATSLFTGVFITRRIIDVFYKK